MAKAFKALSEREFKKLFEQNILPKFTEYRNTGLVEDSKNTSAASANKELDHFLTKELPVIIYATAVKKENKPEPGAIKMLETTLAVGRAALGRGFGDLVPYLVSLIQPSLVALYQNKLESKADRFKKKFGFNVEKWVEDATGLKLDSGDKSEPVTEKPAETSASKSISDLATKPTTP